MISKLENYLAKCPELSPSDIEAHYPESNRQISSIAKRSLNTPGSFKPYCAVKNNMEMEKYLEIIFYNELIFPETKYARFVIVKNYKMSKEEESKFFHLLFNYHLDIDVDDFHYLQNRVREFCPESHITTYNDPWYFRQFIEQVYFSTHRSGVREVLYKCPGIENITYNLDRFDCYNIIGTTAEEILGVPLKILRLLNDTEYQCYLYSEESRKKLLKKYAELSSVINWRRRINESQLKYLLEYEHFGNQTGGKFNKKIFDCFSCITSHYTEYYKIYSEYNKLFKICGNHKIFKDVPDMEEFDDEYSTLRQYKYYCFDRCSETIKELNESPAHDYEYSDDKYIVVAPKYPEDFFYEAKYQQNCVLSYIDVVLKKETNVLFLRRKNSIDKPFVTLEIRDGKIVQACARFNRVPPYEVIEFLTKYANELNLEFNEDDVIVVYAEAV